MALFDSGADLSCISWQMYRRLKKRPHLLPYRNTLTAANGQEIISRGVARLHFQFGDYEFHHNVVVLENLKSDIIVGVDIMRNHSIVLDMGRKKILRRPFNYCKENVDKSIDGIAKGSYVLEPLQAAVIEVSTPSHASIGQAFLASGPHVPQGITETDSNRNNRILIANKSLIPIQICRGDKVCSLEAVDDSDIIHNEASLHQITKAGKDGPFTKENPAWKEEMRGTETAAHHVTSPGYQKTGPTMNTNMIMNVSATNTNHQIPIQKNTIAPDQKINTVKLTDADIYDAVKEVPDKYKVHFMKLIRQFDDVFSADPDVVGKCDVYKQKITLLDPSKVSTQRSYNVAPNLQHVVESYVKKLLAQGVIEESKSPWSSPLLLIKKPGPLDKNNIMKSFRIAHDYRKLNANTLRNSYPLNSIFHLLDRVAGGTIISVLDIASGFWNQMLEDESKPYTAFSVPGLGHYQYTRSAQGLVNSSPSWQKLMDFVISGVPDTFVFVDDIILSSNSVENHLKALEQLFLRFRKHNLKIRVHKVKFGASKVRYLGWDIDVNSGIKPGELKTKAILEYKEPENTTQLKSFLGLCNFFRRCLPFYSQRAQPLTKLTRKDSVWTKGKLPNEASKAFQKLKKLLAERPCLKPIKWDRTFYISVDSSSTGTGVVLSQKDDNGIEHPNMYLSKTNAECKNPKSAFQLESEGIIWAMKQLRCIVQAGECVIRTDHKPLSSLDRSSSPMLDKVYSELNNFNFRMEYMKGQNMISDGLSRQNDHSKCLLCKGNTTQSVATIGAITHYDAIREDTEGIIDISHEQIINLQKEDRYTKALMCYYRYGLLPDKPDFRKWVLAMSKYTTERNGVLGIIKNGHFKVLAPLHVRQTLLTLAHNHEWGGHLNWKRTLHKLHDWYWSKMESDVQVYCQSCSTCQQNNPPGTGHTKMPLGKLESPHKFNAHCHLDLLGPLPESGMDRYKYCLVVTDAYSGFLKVIPLVNKTASEVSKAFLTGWISHFAIPLKCTLDQGSEFTAAVFQELCEKLGTKLIYSSVEHAMSNGKIERQMRNILQYLRKFIDDKPQTWSHYLPSLMSALNTSLHTDKRFTPYELVFGYKPTISTNFATKPYNLDDGGFEHLISEHLKLQQQVRYNYDVAYERNKMYYDAKLNEKQFNLNDTVYLRTPSRTMKLFPRYFGPLRVVEIKGNDNLVMQHLHTGKFYVAHANRVKFGKPEQQVFQDTRDENVKRTEFNVNGRTIKSTAQMTPPNHFLHSKDLRRRNRPGPTPTSQSTPTNLRGWHSPAPQEQSEPTEENEEEDETPLGNTNVHDDTDANLNNPTTTPTFRGPLTRARRKLLEGKTYESILNCINEFQNNTKYPSYRH